jgi:hypothetical protein
MWRAEVWPSDSDPERWLWFAVHDGENVSLRGEAATRETAQVMAEHAMLGHIERHI